MNLNDDDDGMKLYLAKKLTVYTSRLSLSSD